MKCFLTFLCSATSLIFPCNLQIGAPQVTQLGHVKDLASAFTKCLGNKKAYNQIYNISGGLLVVTLVTSTGPECASLAVGQCLEMLSLLEGSALNALLVEGWAVPGRCFLAVRQCRAMLDVVREQTEQRIAFLTLALKFYGCSWMMEYEGCSEHSGFRQACSLPQELES